MTTCIIITEVKLYRTYKAVNLLLLRPNSTMQDKNEYRDMRQKVVQIDNIIEFEDSINGPTYCFTMQVPSKVTIFVLIYDTSSF